jgi:hypothetical protein
MDAAEVVGKTIGVVVVAAFVVAVFSLTLLASWNHCVPQVLGGSEITLSQSLAMLGVAWTLSAVTRFRA